MQIEDTALRFAKLREQKGVSAREMSLALGQNPGYINNIETGKNKPSFEAFFYICEYLNIDQKDFFDTDIRYPQKLHAVIEDLKRLDEAQLDSLSAFLKTMLK